MPAKDDTAATLTLSESGSGGEEFAALLGTTLNERYVLEEKVGQGGFGVVFRARDTRLDKRVAVKVLAHSVAANPDSLARFKQEAVSAARIGHKGIVDVTDVDDDGQGNHFIVMEYIHGVDLGTLLRNEGALALPRALSIAARAAQALAAAHAKGIIHRDLKPANILLTNLGPIADFPKILDFGVSKMMPLGDKPDGLTQDGQVVGTPRYMAPEQGMGNVPIDGRADVYALGTILYEMATGRAPYSGATHYEMLHNKVSMDPLPPGVVHPDLEHSMELEPLVFGALARAPDERFATMADFEAAIRELLETIDPAAASAVRPSEPTPQPSDKVRGESSSTPASTRLIRPTPRSLTPSSTFVRSQAEKEAARRRRWIALAVAACLAAAAAVVAVAYVRGGGDEARDVEQTAPAPAVEATERPAAVATPEMVEIRLVVAPEDAVIEVDGLVSAENPLRFPKSEASYEIVVSAPGYRSEKRTLRPIANGEMRISLEKATEPKPSTPPRKPPRKPHPAPRVPDGPI